MPQQNRFNSLIWDLTYLRKDNGFSVTRFNETLDFANLMGGKKQPFKTVQARLISAINSLPNKKDAEVLLVAYALLDGYKRIPLLKDRRNKYGKQINRKADTIMDRENSAIKELAITLLTARYATSPLPDNAPEIHSSALHERIEITTVVKDYLWTETRELYRLIPLMDKLEYLDISSDIPAKVKSTCDSVCETKTFDEGLRHRFIYSEPLERGKPIELSFIMQPNGVRDDELILIEETRAFHEPAMSCSMEIIFIGKKPSLIWQYSQLPLYERPSKATKQNFLDLNGGSSVKVEFADLYGGLYTGVAWEW